MESLSAESKLLYDILASETDEIYEAKWARSTTRSTAPLRAPGDSAAAASASSATSSTTTAPTTPAASNLVLSFERDATTTSLLRLGCTTSSRAPSKAISTGGILESAAATVVPEKDNRSVTPTNCPTVCPGGDTSATSTPSSPVASSVHPSIANDCLGCAREHSCDFASVYFQWAITVQQSTSSGASLVIPNERAELQQHYTCERVLLLPLVVCKGWISQLILQGQPHYFELMQWSFSRTQQQSAFCFLTPGHILFPCCVVQWEIPWLILVSPDSITSMTLLGL